MKTTNTHILTGPQARASIAAMIRAAQTEINLLAYAISLAPLMDSTLRPSIFSQLIEAPARGVTCTAVIARHQTTSAHEAQNTAAADELKRRGWTVHRYPVRPVMHAKLIIIDNRKIVTGSHNLTSAAMEHNRELSVLTDDATCVYDAQAFFTKLFDASTPDGQDKRTS